MQGTEPWSDGHSLTATGVVMDFKGLRALNGVDLRLRKGEILGLIGPNGSGKTTLVNIISGVLKPTAGRVFAGQKEVTGLPPHLVARAGIGRTFQTARLFERLTVLENIEAAAVAVGVGRRRARSLAEELVEEVGIAPWAERLAGELPYGHKRRLEVARALAIDPHFILLDEPAAGLNPEETRELFHILRTIQEAKGLGLLIIDHDVRLIMRLCHRVHVLAYGETIGEGTPAEVRRIPKVIEAYLGTSAEEEPRGHAGS